MIGKVAASGHNYFINKEVSKLILIYPIHFLLIVEGTAIMLATEEEQITYEGCLESVTI